jgi:hypothetical protein
MAKKRQGWESTLYRGTAGSTAATQITNATDIELDSTIDYGETTVRGAGTLIPHKDRGPVAIDCKITWTMVVKDSDTSLTVCVAAAVNTTPTPLAIKYVNPVTGTLFDGDCYLKMKDGSPLGGAATYDFEAIPTTDGGREWLLGGV